MSSYIKINRNCLNLKQWWHGKDFLHRNWPLDSPKWYWFFLSSVDSLESCRTGQATPVKDWESNQGNQGYSGNQKNVIKGQRPDMENRHTQKRT